MLSRLRAAVATVALFILLLGVGYPLAVTGLAQLALPHQANGSLLTGAGGRVVGSALIAQGFARPEYFHSRGSSAGSNGYDATSSSGSNLGPMDPKLAASVATTAAALRKENPSAAIPADAVTNSASGLDPDISPENAAFQAQRIAQARGLPVSVVQAEIAKSTEQPILGFIGQPHVNVLVANRALDDQHPLASTRR